VVVIERGDDDSTARVFGAARRWIDREATGGRFLLFIDCYGAHPPWYPAELEDDGDEFEEAETADDADDSLDAGPAFNSRAEHESSETDDASNLARQAYAAVVTHVDSEFGSFIDYLRCRPEWEQLAVAVTSDCGASLGDAASAAVGEGQLHEGRTHLPLVLRVPGAHDPGSRTAALVQPIDLLPTVGEALGAGAPDTHGRSLLPIMRMQTRTVRDHALMVEPGHGWSIRTPAWHLILPQRSSVSDAISEPGLFVQPDDRWDRNDVAKQYPEVSEQLEQRLRARIGEP
jgi:arylsulfatase A-like enzyme